MFSQDPRVEQVLLASYKYVVPNEEYFEFYIVLA